jgi:DNA helicase-2/ATP-dependent DNA helicase PcrA
MWNKNQQRAIVHRDGPLRVLAGPGSGKTAVIIQRMLQLIDRGIPPQAILVFTYNKAASEEMKKRFQDHSDAPVVIGTFHGIFFRMLRKRYAFSLEQVVKELEKRDTIKKLLADLKYDLDEDFVSAVLTELSLVKNELIDLCHHHSAVIGNDAFVSLFEQYENYKKQKQKIDFDDMLTLCYELFTREPETLTFWRRR